MVYRVCIYINIYLAYNFPLCYTVQLIYWKNMHTLILNSENLRNTKVWVCVILCLKKCLHLFVLPLSRTLSESCSYDFIQKDKGVSTFQHRLPFPILNYREWSCTSYWSCWFNTSTVTWTPAKMSAVWLRMMISSRYLFLHLTHRP